MRRFDVERFLEDYSIEVAPDGHKHVRKGWIGTICPFCTGNPGYHLGVNETSGAWTCWRCGTHSRLEVVQALLDVSWTKAREIIEKYEGRPLRMAPRALSDLEPIRETKLPPGTGPLGPLHTAYLTKRGFDPDELVDTWGIQGIGPFGGRLKFRILAPIMLRKQMVSYLCRDTTGQATAKYLPCPESEEGVHHKNLVYGVERARGNTVVITEGITDVWKLGTGAVALFGIKFTLSQVRILKAFKRRIILFDRDPQAQAQADKLYKMLEAFTGETIIWDLDSGGDPGELSMKDGALLMNELTRIVI